MTTTAAPHTSTGTGTGSFLGTPPAPASHYIGRITHLHHTQGHAFTHGHLTLPSGVAIPWIAHHHPVRTHRHLFQPDTHVIVTGHELGGPLYLTAIRPATPTEWADAITALTRRH